MPKGLTQTIPLRWIATAGGVIRAKYQSNDLILDRLKPTPIVLYRKIGSSGLRVVNVQARR